jgi:hypothetical protein
MIIKDKMMRVMANWPSPHVRRLLPVASVLLDALDKAGIPYASHRAKQIAIGADYLAKYRHPTKIPRARAKIVITRRNGAVLKEFYSVEDAIAFHLNPVLP